MPGEFNLPRYVSLLKNLRAVVLLDHAASIPENELKWVARKYRYRSIGVSLKLLKNLPDETRAFFVKKPYTVLHAPLVEIETFSELVSAYDVESPSYVVDSLILASCYVNPILVLGRETYRILEPFVACSVKSASELPDLEIKRNLRIIGYAILDFHEKVTREAYVAVRKAATKITGKELKEVEKTIEKRRELAREDGRRRFWRLRREEKEGERPVIAYLDLFPTICKALKEISETRPDELSPAFRLISHIARSTSNLSMALSLIPAFVLQL
jgi:hypothetical protein